MNGTFIFVLGIIAIVTVGNIIKTWVEQRGKVPENDGEAEALLSKIDVLEERIQVLERIVTEHNIDLKQEIDNL
jgi:high-affinity nickel permease